jgi:chorismate synthase
MSSEPVSSDLNVRQVTRPRPGHADLAGGLKHLSHDLRDVLERASARETAARVAAGSLAQLLLRYFHVTVVSHVVAIGGERVKEAVEELSADELARLSRDSEVNCADRDAAQRMIAAIDAAKKDGDTLGGTFEVIAQSVPPGLGSHAQWDRRLDGLIAQAFMSIPAVKAVEIGAGVSSAGQKGSSVHDEIHFDEPRRRFFRQTNRAGGIEGGISNGEAVKVRAFVKPIPTLRKPLKSVDVRSKQPLVAAFERSDTCIVPAAAVIGEAMLSLVLAGVFMEKFGGDSITETEANFVNYMRLLDAY